MWKKEKVIFFKKVAGLLSNVSWKGRCVYEISKNFLPQRSRENRGYAEMIFPLGGLRGLNFSAMSPGRDVAYLRLAGFFTAEKQRK
ncbi:MAG: hypothetical protein WCH52_10640 [Bacteroidota bacterium]